MFESARCIVLNSELDNLEKGATEVYGEYLLLQTSALLPEKIMIPSDICSLVQKTYCRKQMIINAFQNAYEDYKKKCMLRKQNAKPYCLEKPEIGKCGGTLVGLLDKSVGLDDIKAQAAVRDGNPSIEVIVVKEAESGFASIIAGKSKGEKYNLKGNFIDRGSQRNIRAKTPPSSKICAIMVRGTCDRTITDRYGTAYRRVEKQSHAGR